MKAKEFLGVMVFIIGLILCAGGCLWGLIPMAIIAIIASKQPTPDMNGDTAWKDVYKTEYDCNAFGERLK